MKRTTVATYISLALAGLVASPIVAIANPTDTEDGRSEHFAEVDINADNLISHEEMMARVQVRFGEFDKNQDGFLELDELPKLMPVPDHMKKRMKKRMERHGAKMRAKNEDHSDTHGKKMQKGMHDGKGGKPKPTRMKFIAKLDRDGDERVSLEEFAVKAVRHFKQLDEDGDGSVTKEEFTQAKGRKLHKRHKGTKHHGK